MSEYNVGGTLSSDDPNYVSRPADRALYEGLQAGKLCYVFNSRQMGKSSLLAHTKHQLETEGIICAALDLSNKSTQVTSDKWYPGLLWRLSRDLGLASKSDFDFSSWWQAQQRLQLEPSECFEEFLETVVLREITQRVVILIDEIDSILGCDFSDGFFATIRKCYNKRSEQADYRRLSFALAGVATPYDLIQGQSTPFNIGQAIELTGIQLDEAQPLLRGLAGKVDRPEATLREIINWTGGQPFLTQKLCNLVATVESSIAEGAEPERIEQLVQEHILNNWEAQDEPQHLRTIRDRLLSPGNEPRLVRLLGLYQQILRQREIEFDGSPEQLELRLSGLVVNQQGKLRVFNKIYESVFSQGWVREKLDNLRDPKYAAVLAAWLASGQQSEHLLRGDTLRDAQNWSVGKQLSNEDYQFLADSQKQEVQEIQAQVNNQKQKLQRRSIFAGVASILFAASLVGALLSAQSLSKLQKDLSSTEVALTEAEGAKQNAISERDDANKKRDQANQERDSAVAERDGAIEGRDDAKSQALQAEQQAKQANEQAKQAQEDATTAQANAAIARSEAEEARGDRDRSQQEAQIAQQVADLEQRGTALLRSPVEEFRGIDKLLVAMELGQELNQLIQRKDTLSTSISETYLAQSPMVALRLAINNVLERNTIADAIFEPRRHFLPDGKQLLVQAEGSTYLYDLASGRQVRQFEGGWRFGQGDRANLSPDGQWLVTTKDSTVDEQVVYLVYRISGEQLAQIQGNESDLGQCFSADGKHLIISRGNSSYLFDQSSNSKVIDGRLAFCDGYQKSAFTSNQKYFATTDGSKSYLYDFSGEKYEEFYGDFVTFSEDGQKVVTKARQGDITYSYLYDLTGMRLAEVLGDFQTFNQDGSLIVTQVIENSSPFSYLYNLSGVELARISGSFQSFNKNESFILSTLHNDNISYLHNLVTQQTIEMQGGKPSWSPDGSLFVTSIEDDYRFRDYYLYDLSGQQLARIRGSEEVFSPDGKYWAVFTYEEDDSYLFDSLGNQTKLKGTSPRFNSATNQLITSAQNGRSSYVYNLSSHQSIELPGKFSGFTPDNQRLITYSEVENLTYLYSLSGSRIAQFSGYFYGFSPDEKRLRTTSYQNTNSDLSLYDFLGNQLIQIPSYGLVFSPDGNHLAAYYDGPGETHLYNLTAPNWSSRIRAFDVQISPSGRNLVVESPDGNTSVLYDAFGNQVAQFKGRVGKFSNEDEWLITYDPDLGISYLCNLETQSSLTLPIEYSWLDVEFSDDSQWLAVIDDESTTYLYDLSTGEKASFQERFSDFSPDGKWLAISSPSNGISYLYELSSGQKIQIEGSYPKFSADSQWIVMASGSLYSLATLEMQNLPYEVKTAVFSPNGSWLLVEPDESPETTAPQVSYLYNLDISIEEPLAEIVGDQPKFSPNGKYVITEFDGELRNDDDDEIHLYNLQGEKVAEFLGDQISFSPDDSWLAVYNYSSDNSEGYLYDLIEQERIGIPMTSYPEFSFDGKRVVVRSEVEDISRVYDRSGNLLAEYPGGQDRQILFASNEQLITKSRDGYFYTWQLDEGLDDLLARGCNWLSAYFETHPEALERLRVCQK